MGGVTLLGFGNRLWRDEGAGSLLVERLKRARPDLQAVDGGMVPENHLERVVRTAPELIVMVDAADFEGEPGELRLFTGDELAFTGLSTHAGSPRMLAHYLESRTGAEVVLLAIQPASTAHGAGLTPSVEARVNAAVAQCIGPTGVRRLLEHVADGQGRAVKRQ